MKTRDEHFATLLRWYPRSWRDANAAVVLGTLLDAADAAGRTRPTAAERRSAAWDGLGHRLDRRLAIITATAAVVLALTAVIATYAFTPLLSGPPTSEVAGDVMAAVIRVFAVAASLALTITSLIATVRPLGLPAGAALCAALAGALAGLSLAPVQMSWFVGFDAADAGIPPSPLGDALPALILTCALLGGVSVMFATAPLLHRVLSLAAWPVMLVLGTVTWTIAAYVTVNPPVAALCALGMLIVAVSTPRGDAAATRTRGSDRTRGHVSAPRATPLTAPHRCAVALLSTLAALVGLAALAFCAAGPRWTGVDATRALQVGIGIGLLAACPLVVAAGIARPGRAVHRSPAHSWGPVALWCTGLVIAASAYLFASISDSGTIFVMLQVAAVPLAIGTAWWIVTIHQGTRTARQVGGVAGAIGVLLLAWTLPMLPFVTPILAGIVAVVAGRTPRPAPFGVASGR